MLYCSSCHHIFPDNTFKTIKNHLSKTCNSCLTKWQKIYKPVQVSKGFKKPLNDITNGIVNEENNLPNLNINDISLDNNIGICTWLC